MLNHAPPESRKPLSLFAAVRGKIWVIVTLSLVGAVASVVPFIGMIELARALWPALAGLPVDPARAWGAILLIVGALVLSFASAGASGLVSHLADNDLQLDLRGRIVRHLRTQPLGWFDGRSTGAIKKAVDNDVNAIHQLIAHAIQDVITAVTVPVITLAYLFIVEWRMALFALVPIMLTAFVFAMMNRGADEQRVQYELAVERLSAATIEYVHGIAVVKSFGLAGRSHQRFTDESQQYATRYGGWMRDSAFWAALVELLTSPVVSLLLIAVPGVLLAAAGEITPLDVLPALLLGVGLTAPLMQLGFSTQFLRAAFQARDSLSEFFASPPMPQPEHPATPAGTGAAFDQVRFSYDGERDVLRDITASCLPGTVTALVGPSGSGKSTLARLVPRFYDVTGGAVRIGEADVRELGADGLYGAVGFVFQDAYLLRTTIRDNIRLTRPEATPEQVAAAARAAQIHDRVLELPRGYDSVIGEDAHLSGGEAQRLTIARALLTDAPILVLDEATAFADPDSEAAIQTALSELARERTLLVIAHRLHTITGADQILVLDAGVIVERGTHAELTAAGGVYAGMWQSYQRARGAIQAPVEGHTFTPSQTTPSQTGPLA